MFFHCVSLLFSDGKSNKNIWDKSEFLFIFAAEQFNYDYEKNIYTDSPVTSAPRYAAE